jgi:hypothetical protein
VFQSAAPSIFETSSRLSLWLMLTDLLVRDWRSVCAIALASRKSRMSDILCMSEPDASGGCVADPVARAKEERRLDTFTVPKWAQPAGRINRASMMRLALVPVNREGRLAAAGLRQKIC